MVMVKGESMSTTIIESSREPHYAFSRATTGDDDTLLLLEPYWYC
jgi:hypothetical protein